MGVFVVAEKGWFWRKQGSVFGPVTEVVLRARILDGDVTRGMPVRCDDGDWIPVERVEDWELLLGSAENLRTRDREASLRRGFGMAGLMAALCVSAWSVASQVHPSPGSQLLLDAQTLSEVETRVDSLTEVAEENGGLGRGRIAEGFEEVQPSLQGCAERFQLHGGEVPKQMVLSYIIQNSGAVTDVLIHPHRVASSPMGRCMVGVMRRLDYPTFVGKVRPVSFPVAFD
jgi:hypothetical protein